MKRRLRYALPLVCWVMLLYLLSSQSYHQQTIIPYLEEKTTIQELSAKVPDVTFRYGRDVIQAKKSPYEFVEFVFRKSAHLFVYSMLGALGYIALVPYRLPKAVKFAIVLVFVGGLAFMDEINQTHSTLRTGRLQDVELNCVGGLIGLSLAMALTALRKKREEKKAVS